MPYSWDDGSDFDGAAATGGFSYHDARRSYDDVSSVTRKAGPVYTYQSPFPKTDALYPLIIGIDTTGSMAEWPKLFFEKLPLLYKEAVKYLPDCEISFQAINDFAADGADVALQPAPFGRGPRLDEYIAQLYPVGGGGGQRTESYDIFAAYNGFLEAPKAVIKPVAVILGDEAPFPNVPGEVCRAYGISKGEAVFARTVFDKLLAMCDVYLVRKPYGGDDDREIVAEWKKLAGIPDERILTIEDPRRVVDVILGILGVLTGKTNEFAKELKSRQDDDQVDMVMKTLNKLSAASMGAKNGSQYSKTKGAGGASSKGLPLDNE